jgi:hypothetical protein
MASDWDGNKAHSGKPTLLVWLVDKPDAEGEDRIGHAGGVAEALAIDLAVGESAERLNEVEKIDMAESFS